MQPIVEMIKRDMAASNGERRPYLSLSGPKNICPAANPIILAVNPNCTNEGVVLKYAPIEGRLGRYMSVTNGPNAESPARVIKKSVLFIVKRLPFVHEKQTLARFREKKIRISFKCGYASTAFRRSCK